MRTGLIRIGEIDSGDESALRAFHALTEAVTHHDRPHGVPETWPEFRDAVQEPGRYTLRVLIGAYDDAGALRGGAALRFGLDDNPRLALGELWVAPDARRQGTGTALLAAAEAAARGHGRTTMCWEVEVAVTDGVVDGTATGFAAAHGYALVLEEDHLVLDLPVPVEDLERIRGLGQVPGGDGYDVVTWRRHCPEEHLAAYCRLNTQMEHDVPVGGIDYEPVSWDADRLRDAEERWDRSWVAFTAAARRPDGEMCGFSNLLVSRDDAEVVQADTLVMPAERGHRLGTRLKLANLEAVLAEFPGHRRVHTWTARDNAAMQRTNADFGFVARERSLALQRELVAPEVRPADLRARGSVVPGTPAPAGRSPMAG